MKTFTLHRPKLLNVLSSYANHVRYARSKPWIPKFRLLRNLQPYVPPMNISELQETFKNKTPDEIRLSFKRLGFLPHMNFRDRPINMQSTGMIIESYKPLDEHNTWKDSVQPLKKKLNVVDNVKNKREIRKIKGYVPEFDTASFGEQAEQIYVDAHRLLMNYQNNEDEMLALVTEKAFYEMTNDLKFKTFRWNFHGPIEPSRVVQSKFIPGLVSSDYYAQVTVRHFTQQSLAIYDRFGRLSYGDENVVKDVLEYVVYERFIVDQYSRWRMHGKIVGDAFKIPHYRRTVKIPEEQKIE